MNEKIYDIALSFDESLTPIEKTTLLNKYVSSKTILELNKSTLRNILGRRWTGNRFHPHDFIEKAKKLLPFIENAGIRLLRFDNPKFPDGLKMIPDFPFLIYYRGNIQFDYNKSIAIVGTRKPDEIGLKRIKKYTTYLVKKGYTIISGLAHGIDASSHYNCIINNGKTIAVLGCGIDRIYPFSNKDLGKMILEKGGGIVSEYPPGIPPKKWNFPKRNRIIVGLSRGVLIAQSPSRSGSQISAILAADYNRELFVVSPNKECGSIDAGNLELIMSGAIEVNEPDEISLEWACFVK
ncbi:MAG: DNA-processing protein DprA [Spirochaetes bacterium]|nr:DNA-processing protein DprA [Spirochaetota bacterium]